MNGIIFLRIIVPFVVQPLVSLGVSIPGTAAAAVLTKAALDEFLVFLRRVRIAEMGVHRQSVICGATQKEPVDFVLRDEHFTLAQEAGLSIKVSFLVWQAVEDDTDAVGVIAADTETHVLRGCGVGIKEGMIFLCQSLQSTLSLCKGHHILIQFRVALALVMDGQRLRE